MIVLKHVLLLSALVLVCSGIWTCVVESSGVPQEEGKKRVSCGFMLNFLLRFGQMPLCNILVFGLC